MTDPIADMLTRLRNAARARKTEFTVPYSRLKSEIARILEKEGYIAGFELETPEKGHPNLKIKNKFVNKVCAIAGLKRVSKPGLRRYVGANEVPRVLGGMGIAVLSTSRGVLTGHEARKQNVGGELLAYIW
jgi:small subunit ribosomal protein S8